MADGVNGPLRNNEALNVLAGTSGLNDNEALNVMTGGGAGGPSLPVIIQVPEYVSQTATLQSDSPDEIVCNTDGGTIVLTLPSITATTPGKKFRVKCYGANNVTVTPFAGDEIVIDSPSENSVSIAPGGAAAFLRDGQGGFWQAYAYATP